MNRIRSIGLGTLVLGALLCLSTPADASGKIAVVVHSSVNVEGLTFAQLRNVLLGNQQFWPGNQRVTLLVRAPTSDERTVLLRRVYAMSEAQFQQYWIAKVFRAEATSGPRIVTSNDQTGLLVKAIPGAIGLVNASQIPPGVKVLAIDGKRPTESGYILSY